MQNHFVNVLKDIPPFQVKKSIPLQQKAKKILPPGISCPNHSPPSESGACPRMTTATIFETIFNVSWVLYNIGLSWSVINRVGSILQFVKLLHLNAFWGYKIM